MGTPSMCTMIQRQSSMSISPCILCQRGFLRSDCGAVETFNTFVRLLSLGYKNNRFSSNDEHGTVRVLHHPRRNAPDEKPGDAAQPLGPHHDQIGLVFGDRLHDLFSRLPTFEPRG